MSASPLRHAMWQGSRPWLIWALHFFACYVLLALGCDQGWGMAQEHGTAPLRWSLLLLTALAMMGAGLCVYSGCKSVHQASMLPVIQALSGALAMLAIVWTAVPLWLQALCHFN